MLLPPIQLRKSYNGQPPLFPGRRFEREIYRIRAAHLTRVHALADRLAGKKGIDLILDRDTRPGGPDEGWPEWSERQVKEADHVLIACSEEYALRYGGNDDGTERGKGASASLIPARSHSHIFA